MVPGYHLPGGEEADDRAPEQFIGTEAQRKGSRFGISLQHLLARPTQERVGITLTMWGVFFFPLSFPSPPFFCTGMTS